MKIYYIYHIKGKKIGCTQHPKRRTKIQGFNNYEILEEHTDIYLASNRELELQKQWGYSVDRKPYWKSIKMSTFNSRSKGGKTNASIVGRMSELGRISSQTVDRLLQLTLMQIAKRKPVIQMDILGNSIKEFDSITQASNTLGIGKSNISYCCKGKQKTTHGFTFKYKYN